MTPSKLKTMPFDEVSKICHGYAVTAIETIGKLTRPGANHPLRFIYISGVNGQRDPAKKPWIMGDYSLLRVCQTLFLLVFPVCCGSLSELC